MYRDSPEQRYLNFLNSEPNLLKRIPQSNLEADIRSLVDTKAHATTKLNLCFGAVQEKNNPIARACLLEFQQTISLILVNV